MTLTRTAPRDALQILTGRPDPCSEDAFTALWRQAGGDLTALDVPTRTFTAALTEAFRTAPRGPALHLAVFRAGAVVLTQTTGALSEQRGHSGLCGLAGDLIQVVLKPGDRVYTAIGTHLKRFDLNGGTPT